MSYLGNVLKVFQYQLLQQGGVAVTPEQLGLKFDPNTVAAQGTSGNSAFSQALGALSGQNNALPTPPTAPEDASDAAAQAEYNTAMTTYNQKMAAYNNQMMQRMMMQFAAMQQQIQQMALANRQNNTSSSESSQPIGVGGILGKDI